MKSNGFAGPPATSSSHIIFCSYRENSKPWSSQFYSVPTSFPSAHTVLWPEHAIPFFIAWLLHPLQDLAEMSPSLEAIPDPTKCPPPIPLPTLRLICFHHSKSITMFYFFAHWLVSHKPSPEKTSEKTNTVWQKLLITLRIFFSSFLLVKEHLDLWLCPWPPT